MSLNLVFFKFSRAASYFWQACSPAILMVGLLLALICTTLLFGALLVWCFMFSNNLETGEIPNTFWNIMKAIGIFIGAMASGVLWTWILSKLDD